MKISICMFVRTGFYVAYAFLENNLHWTSQSTPPQMQLRQYGMQWRSNNLLSLHITNHIYALTAKITYFILHHQVIDCFAMLQASHFWLWENICSLVYSLSILRLLKPNISDWKIERRWFHFDRWHNFLLTQRVIQSEDSI